MQIWRVTTWGLPVYRAPKAWSLGEGPSAQQGTWSRNCLAARPEWKLHLIVQTPEAAGECDEAAETGPPAEDAVSVSQKLRLCRQRSADEVCSGKSEPGGLEWGPPPGATWEQVPGVGGNLWWASGALRISPGPPHDKWTDQEPVPLRYMPGSYSKVIKRWPIRAPLPLPVKGLPAS